MKAFLLFLTVLVTHYGYQHLSGDSQESSWWFYIFRGIEGTILFVWLAFHLKNTGERIAVIACVWGALEEAQTGLCGAAAFGHYGVPHWSGLCLEEFGPIPYAIAAATALVFLRTRTWTKKA